MKKRRFPLLLVAVVFILVFVFLIAKAMRQQQQQTASQYSQVLVAKTNLPYGTVLTPTNLAAQTVLTKDILPDEVTNVNRALGLATNISMTAGDPLLLSHLVPAASLTFGHLLPPNTVSYTIPVSGISGQAGLLNVGDSVDILIGLTGSNNSSSSRYSLRNARIYALNSDVIPGTTVQGYASLTIAVTPLQAEALQILQLSGAQVLVLDNAAGSTTPNVQTLTNQTAGGIITQYSNAVQAN